MKMPRIPKPDFSKIPNFLNGNKGKKVKNAGLDNKLLKELRKKLESDKKEIENELQKIAVKDKKIPGDYDTKFPSYGSSMDENAMEVTDYQDRLSLHHTLKVDLLKINNALGKMKAGTYGMCENCTQPISIERLRANSAATVCLDCAGK